MDIFNKYVYLKSVCVLDSSLQQKNSSTLVHKACIYYN